MEPFKYVGELFMVLSFTSKPSQSPAGLLKKTAENILDLPVVQVSRGNLMRNFWGGFEFLFQRMC